MKTDPLVNTEYFSQFKLVLEAGEVAELGAFMIDQTFYILTGAGFIETHLINQHIKCGSFIHIESNTPYRITNSERSLLTIILTQSKSE